MTCRAHITACLFGLALLTPASALAQDSEAQLHDELGRTLYAQDQYSEALGHFLSANRLAPTANRTLNIARIYGFLSRPVEAYNWYETYLTQFEVAATEQARTERDGYLDQVAVVEVRTSPPLAELFVDRTDLGAVGRSPRRVAMAAGAHRIVARAENHHEGSTEVEAELGQLVELEIVLEPLLGRLVIESSPSGATVRLAEQSGPLGTTPLDREISVGSRRLVISADGYIEQTLEVTITAHEPIRRELRLTRLPATVSLLSVVADQAGATVLLDGQEAGQTPLSLGDLEPGSRQLEVRAQGRVSWTTEILLEPGGASRVEVNLAEERRVWPGWRWIGYGSGAAILMVGAILGGMALSNRNAFYESDNPSADVIDRVQAEALAADIMIGLGSLVIGVTLILDLIFRNDPESTGTLTIDR